MGAPAEERGGTAQLRCRVGLRAGTRFSVMKRRCGTILSGAKCGRAVCCRALCAKSSHSLASCSRSGTNSQCATYYGCMTRGHSASSSLSARYLQMSVMAVRRGASTTRAVDSPTGQQALTVRGASCCDQLHLSGRPWRGSWRFFSSPPRQMLKRARSRVARLPLPRSARLMLGQQTVATVARGQELPVLKVEGNWIGTKVEVAGKSVAGWIWLRQVAPSGTSLAQQSIQRRFSFEPDGELMAPAPRSYSYSPPRSSGARTPSYMLPKTDPNRFR